MRISQVISNLLSNAMKFTLDNGKITIKAVYINNVNMWKNNFKNELNDDLNSNVLEIIKVSVKDNGPGICLEHHDDIFSKYGQVENDITRKKGGTGLGLHIAKEIVQKHKGKIWVDSEQGKGAKFCFTLPVHQEDSLEHFSK